MSARHLNVQNGMPTHERNQKRNGDATSKYTTRCSATQLVCKHERNSCRLVPTHALSTPAVEPRVDLLPLCTSMSAGSG